MLVDGAMNMGYSLLDKVRIFDEFTSSMAKVDAGHGPGYRPSSRYPRLVPTTVA